LFWDETSQENQDAIINKVADTIIKNKMDTAAILLLLTFKPLVPIGGQLGRFFIGPLLPFMSDKEDALIQTFERQENIEKLVKILEDWRDEEEEKRKKEKRDEGTSEKKGWKRFLPFKNNI